jgi:hypothetical protein
MIDREIFQLVNGKKAVISNESFKALVCADKIEFVFKGKCWYGQKAIVPYLKDGAIVEFGEDTYLYVYAIKA